MLAIRMQRTGRKGHAQFRMIVQDSRRSPSSGNIVELLGSFDPHTKVATLNKDRITFFLNNGAQPSDRVLRILGHQKVAVPSWVEKAADKKSKTKNPEKLRKNQPKVEAKPEEAPATEAEVVETPVDEVEAKPEETPVDEVEVEPIATEAKEELVAESTEPEPTGEVEAPKE